MEHVTNELKTLLPEIKRACAAKLMKLPGVVSCGIGYKTANGRATGIPCIVVGVREKKPLDSLKKSEMVPEVLTAKRSFFDWIKRKAAKSVVTDVVETKEIKTLHKGRHRPPVGGISIGHVDVTAGTFGGLFTDAAGVKYILSNNHVLANSNAGQVGDPIIQPGAYDGGLYPQDHVANLHNFVPIAMSGTGIPSECPIAGGLGKLLNGLSWLIRSKTKLQAITARAETNLVDAAIAKPISEDMIPDGPDIIEIGTPQGPAEGRLGMEIKKSGRTTGYTRGVVTQVDVTVQVNYGDGKIATFEDQLMAGAMSAGGDSGSLVLNQENEIIGLLFAGSETTTVINRIQNVMELLDIEPL